jgi:hypothetical protein
MSKVYNWKTANKTLQVESVYFYLLNMNVKYCSKIDTINSMSDSCYQCKSLV